MVFGKSHILQILYRPSREFPTVIPTIPMIPRYYTVPTLPTQSGIFECHTCDNHDITVLRDTSTSCTHSIVCFQYSCPRYPRKLRYGIPRYIPGERSIRYHTNDSRAKRNRPPSKRITPRVDEQELAPDPMLVSGGFL